MLDMKTCNECNGTKLKKESLNVFLTTNTRSRGSKGAKDLKEQINSLSNL
jgi:excinuclease UvrABC ATPase subunit